MSKKKLLIAGLAGVATLTYTSSALAAPLNQLWQMNPNPFSNQDISEWNLNSNGEMPPMPPDMNNGTNSNMEQGMNWQMPEFPPNMSGNIGQDMSGQTPQAPPDMSGNMGQDMSGQMTQTPPDMNSSTGQDMNGQMTQTPPDMNSSTGQNMSGQMPPDMNNSMGQDMSGQMSQTPPGMNGNMGQPPTDQGENAIDNQDNNSTGFFQRIGQFFSRIGEFFQRGFQNLFGDFGIFNNNSSAMGQPGMDNTNVNYTAANNVEKDITGGDYSSSKSGESVFIADNTNATLSGVTINKTGDTNSESSDFYGTNAAVLAKNGSELTIKDTTLTTNASHANGAFSYGKGTVLNLIDTIITTTGNNSGGIMTTGGATTNATNLTVNTSGNSSAAIRSDRGGGTVNVNSGTYNTSGVGSPAIYSTADINVSDASLSATNSEAVVIEGGNSVSLTNSTVSGNNATLNGQSTLKTNVLIYQSMSGDASEGNSSFEMTGGTLISGTGSMFHVTNTTTEITLNNVSLINASDSSDLLIASADSWGMSGKNGGNVTLNLISQSATGNITIDSISSLQLNITSGSNYTGSINNSGKANVTLSSDSSWTLTADTYIDSFTGDYSNINANGYHLYVSGVQVL